MDAHRLRSVVDFLIAEHRRTEIAQRFTRIEEGLEKAAAKPSAEADERFRSAFTDLLAALRDSRTHDMIESDRRIVAEIGGSRYTGWGLAERVLEVANERPFLPGRAKSLFSNIAAELEAWQNGLVSVQAGLSFLDIGPRAADGGLWELGILLPERLIKGDAGNVVHEISAWDEQLKTLLPLFSEGMVTVALRTNTTERFELSVLLDRERALALGTIVARVYEMFQEVRLNRRRAEDMEKHGYPSEVVGKVTGYEQRLINEGLQGLRAKLTQRLVRKNAGKPREIERRLDASLRFIAVRVREGVDVELTGPAPANATRDANADPVTHHVRTALLAAEQAGPSAPSGAAKSGDAEAPRLPLSKIAEGGGDEERKAA
jgi:hypothetical protein